MQDSKEILKNIQNEVEQQQEKINSNIKKWIKRNFQKIVLLFAVITGVTGLILGIVANNKRDNLQHFLDHDYSVHWGGDKITIWKTKLENSKFSMDLYFNIKPIHANDIKWNGIYSSDYFIKD